MTRRGSASTPSPFVNVGAVLADAGLCQAKPNHVCPY